MSSPALRQDQQDSGASVSASAAGVACNGCRKAKLRCSKNRPACSYCIKTEQGCVYETNRVKPGIKTGAIEGIQKRLDIIEQRLDQDTQSSSAGTASNGCKETNGDRAESAAEAVLSLLAREIPKVVKTSKPNPESPCASKQILGKRRRLFDTAIATPCQNARDHPPFPPSEMFETLLDTYFSHVHPWIPMLNQDRFRQRVEDPEELLKLEVVLHSIVITVLRYLPDLEEFEDAWPAERTRGWIVMTSMESNTIEGLQALIILAFNDIGSGNAARAWGIIASLSRTVEFFQLTMDHEVEVIQPICRPFSYLGPAKDWADQEERRRVVWNVFLLDRFCSITMGWNTSLKSTNVHLRLPCDGILWRKQEAVLTPYLGIWDRSTSGMGNIIATAAHRENQPGLERDSQGQANPIQTETDVSRIGAFAYCVEATESMSRVTTYFLQQRINPNDLEAVNSWFARFKELDLRLLHWKLFLPQKWKPNIPREASRMDPNLTLAHIAHNASTILLHQLIAWPPYSWPFRKQLPCARSAETCCSAGIEISTITRKFLESTRDAFPLTSLFAFCVYIAARMILIHWRDNPSNHRLQDFWSMIKSLEEMSRRWRGIRAHQTAQPTDLAAKYALRLRGMYQRYLNDEYFSINVSDYAQEIDHRSFTPLRGSQYSASQQYPIQLESQQQWPAGHPVVADIMPFSNTNEASHAPPEASPVNFASLNDSQVPLSGSASNDSAEPSGMGLGPFMSMDGYFMDMDRVIAFDDGSLFSAGLESGSW